jgi:hypothetical protein
MKRITIECYLSIGCGAEDALWKNIGAAMAVEGVDADVRMSRITDDEARERGFRGSPTVLVNGVELDPADMDGFS